MNIHQFETELKKLSQMPPWGKKQTDDWDMLSNFVYQLPSYESLIQKLLALHKGTDFDNYVLHRWYNTLSARAVEQLFCSCEGVKPNINQYDKLVDFTINGIAFDHKTSVFPKGYPKDINFAQQNPKHLIEWLYAQQSTQQRFHQANRLFIILHAQDGQHWKLRAELKKLESCIKQYVQQFEANKLQEINFTDGKIALSDVIWLME